MKRPSLFQTSMALFAAIYLASEANAQTSTAAENGRLYLESPGEFQIYMRIDHQSGQKVLAPMMRLPEQTLVSIETDQLAKSVEAQMISPATINMPYVEDLGENTVPQMSKNGWVCGVQVVDVPDELLRDAPILEMTDLCLSQVQIKKMSVIDSNGAEVALAAQSFIERGEINALQDLKKSLDEEKQKLAGRPFVIQDIAASNLISPIKDCSKGCLKATSEYGMRYHPVLKKKRLHKGIDLRAKTGTPVVSVLKGKILANRTEKSKSGKIKGYGHYVIVVHPEAGLQTLYAHLSSFKSKSGANVSQGSLIALSGASGIGTGPHLHFETHAKGKPVNPRNYIKGFLAMTKEIFNKLLKLTAFA